MLDLTKKYKRNPDVIIKNIGKTQIALNTESGSEYKLNEVSYDMLEQLSSGLSVETLIEKMTQLYDVSKETMTADCEKWLSVALEKELILLSE
jgi:hypothetical protein